MAFDIGPLPGRPVEGFQVYVTGPRRNLRFASRPLYPPLTVLSRLSSPDPFLLFFAPSS